MRAPSKQEESVYEHTAHAAFKKRIWDRIQRPVDVEKISRNDRYEVVLNCLGKRPFTHAS